MLCFSKGILAGGKAHKESSTQCALQGFKTTIFHNSNAIKPALNTQSLPKQTYTYNHTHNLHFGTVKLTKPCHEK